MRALRERLVLGVALLAMVTAGRGETIPLFQNSGTVVDPQVDATAVDNSGLFQIQTFTTLPYDTANTLFYTNQFSGVMDGVVGFRFEFVTNTVRLPAANFVNEGTVSGGTYVIVNATNIINSGVLAVGSGGLIRISGQNVDLTRGGLSAGGASAVVGGRGFSGLTSFFPPPGVGDRYWADGTNNRIASAGPQTPLSTFNTNFLQSPFHQIVQVFPGGFFTNFTQLPEFSSPVGYQAHVFTNQAFGEQIVQVVFTPTSADSNLVTTVRFSGFGLESTAIVEFALPDTDIVTGEPFTNYIYLLDSAAVLGTNGFRLATNLVTDGTTTPTFKPAVYEISRSTPFEWFFSVPTNTPFTPDLINSPNYLTNTVDLFYVAYSAVIGTNFSFTVGGSAFDDPTNAPGRIEIRGNNLDLSMTRARAENFLSIQTSNLTGSGAVLLDAPLLNLELASLAPVLDVDMLSGNTVRRLSGTLDAWTGIWTNREVVFDASVARLVTNTIQFHVLIVDHAFNTTVPVALGNFAVTSTNIIISDDVSPQLTLRIDAETLTINTNGSLNVPFNLLNLNVNNLPRLRCFTNLGFVFVPGSMVLGNDRPLPLTNFINRGSIAVGSLSSVGALQVRSLLAENSGSLSVAGGPVLIDALTAVFTNGSVSSGGNVTFSANDVLIRETDIQAANTLFLSPTNSFSDGGLNASNAWLVNNGFQLLRKPPAGDLLGTTLTSTTRTFFATTHLWAGQDRGATVAGYSNNVALGRLVLDGGLNSLFRFNGTGVSNALYVDFLELRNFATNFPIALQIATNMVVYFADANLPVDKLNGAIGGRLRWVQDFAGPNSSTNALLTNGMSITVNRALRVSTSIDSDADGIVNGLDPFPFDGVVINCVVAVQSSPFMVTLGWNAAADMTYYIEKAGSPAGPWEPVTTYTHGPDAGQASVTFPGNPTGAWFFRVLYYP